MSGQPTPGPWHIRDTQPSGIEIGTDELKVAKVFTGDGHAGYVEEQANARFIVQACNSHDELLKTAKATRAWMDAAATRGAAMPMQAHELRVIVKNALDKAEGRE